MTIAEAVRKLRKLSGLNQQYFATKLDMSTRALQQYEQGKTPEVKQLLWLYAEAHQAHRTDLCDVFANALNELVKAPPGFYVAFQYGPNESRGSSGSIFAPLKGKKK